MALETFEQVLGAVQAGESMNAAWKKFVNTTFFVPVAQPGGAGGVTLRTRDIQGDGSRAIMIAEVREAAHDGQGSLLVALLGADVVCLLQPDAAIVVALSERTFEIAHDRVAWLRKSIEVARAKSAMARDAAPAPAPAPAPVATAKAAPPRRPSNAPLDVAALKPRNVVISDICLEFFVPSAWRESGMPRGLRYHDDSGTVLEASGHLRPDVPLGKWVEMRLALVKHEMRYLTLVGEPTDIHGDDWRDRVKGRTIEFSGTIPGDDFESRYLLACVRTDDVVAVIAIRAPADVFERDRSLYKWFLSRVNLRPMSAPAPYRAPGASAGFGSGNATPFEPGVFGMSMEGRIGRLRALAYSLPLLLAMVLLGIAAAVIMPKAKILGGGLFLVGGLYAIYSSVRLMVLRLHDINVSGKWLLGFLLLIGLAGALRNSNFVMIAAGIFWIGTMLIYCLVPGTGGDNDYGAAPGPNSTMVKIGATLVIIGQLGSIGGQSQMQGMGTGMGTGAGAHKPIRADPSAWHSPDDGLFIRFPGKPVEDPNPGTMSSGTGSMRQFSAEVAGAAYVVQVYSLGVMPEDETAVLDSVQAALIGSDGKLLSGRMAMQFDGHRGRDMRIGIPGNMTRSAKFAVAGSKVYVAMAVSDSSPASEQAVEAFLESYRVTR
ncbi:DUF805 domain-containing protein [Massilia sp. CCM 8734]|uniref:DUF805 domain-containing protein n=1 Tax=Massilia sp. CCM 8734 TaxID=2609283 RepID=UPI001420757C|nr:DUF805 domain-containing protein [Massilia sp. CCM 8734]NHZ97318.1 DUF805 domain-containing protein [Massilia sp. CCM 8734]